MSAALIIPPPSVVSDGQIAEMVRLASDVPSGHFVEVGVFRGGTAWHLARLAGDDREVHLFDTFSGMPFADKGDEHKVGHFCETSHELVAATIPTAVLHIGVFPDTLPADLTGLAFVHVDCDQYRSVRDCILHLWPRMVKGGIMLFDDWRCTTGATVAVIEAFGDGLPETAQGRAWVRKP